MRGGDGADDAGAQGGGLPDDRSLSAGRQEGEGRLLDELVALSGHSRRYAAALGYTGHERMHQREDDMLKIWGRADGSNVIKAMWCIGELGIAHERIDWGGEFGGNDNPTYRRKNPNGRLPTLEEEDGWTLWESGAVVRYLCMKHSLGTLCPETPRGRADAEKWMDWSSLNFAGFNSIYLQHYFGPEAKRNRDAILAAAKAQKHWLDILERQLADRQYLCGDRFTMADIPVGSLTHRWLHWTPKEALPEHPNVRAWYERLAARPAYREHVIEVNAKRTQEIAARG